LLVIKNKNYPEVLILEMGIDRPGDMDYLLSITKCDVGVITTIGQSHLEYFSSVEAIEKEKVKIIKNLKKDGTAVLNFDDERTDKIIKSSSNKILTFGFGKDAMLKAVEVSHSFEKNKDIMNLKGINFKISYDDSVVSVLIPDALSQTTVYAGIIGAAVGVTFDIDLIKISEALRSLKMPIGRTNLINGIKRTLIIDDTYNSSPQSSKAVLDTMARLDVKNNKKYAVLGDMLELGDVSKESHYEIGEYVVKSKIDVLIVVGERGVDVVRGAEQAGMKKDFIFHFDNSEEAGKFIQDRIVEGDLILVKGSQGVRMEKIVKEIMAEPLRAKELLCRQDEEWIK
jgi:UDP-N-acetylmuramoyl-tripeptide--D-alanyl-D-alanine ligase